MMQLSMLWIVMGMLVGLMVCGAWPEMVRLALSAHSRPLRVPAAVLVMLGGAVLALAGGWLGVLLIGQFLATMMALWVSSVGVLAGLWASTHYGLVLRFCTGRLLRTR